MSDSLPTRQDYEDRLVDQALGEAIGGQAPPDLSDDILAAAHCRGWSKRSVPRMAIAATVLIAMGVGAAAYWQAQQRLQAERVAHNQNNLRQHGLAFQQYEEVRTLDENPADLATVHSPNPALRAADPTAVDSRFGNVTLETGLYEGAGRAAPAGGPNPATPQYGAGQGLPSEWYFKSASESKPGLLAGVDGGVDGGEASARSRTESLGLGDVQDQERDRGPGAAVGLDLKAKFRADLEVVENWARQQPPMPNGPPILYPSREFWQELSERRSRLATPGGQGPGQAGDRYSRIVENPFLTVQQNPLSTFSIDVDTASYAKVRRYLMEAGMLPPPDAVRLEELINYFSYDYPAPEGKEPFSAHVEVAACPWQPKHRLARVGLKGKEIKAEDRPASNLVFLLDVSGSMEPDDRLPRVRRAMRMLVEQLGENDRVAIVVYAGASGLVLPSTPGYRKEEIVAALENLQAGGSTNGAAGIHLAYATAAEHLIGGGTNRVILCTDGDFNVGTTSTADLKRLAEEKARHGVFLTVLGFGMGNHNDDMLEKLADKGNGNYGYVDSDQEARKLLVDELGGTLITIAKDVKIQIEFNPRQVAAYRLIGYENRMLRAEDFNDDKKDAGEIGAGHSVTALYELVPAGKEVKTPAVDALKYQQPTAANDAAVSAELLTLKLRYKDPDGQQSHEPLVFPVKDSGHTFAQASADFKFASAVASFGMLLRNSQYRGETSYDAVLEIAGSNLGPDKHGYRGGFLELVRKAKSLAGN